MFQVTNNKLSPLSIHIRQGQFAVLSSPLIATVFFQMTNSRSPFTCPIRSFTGIPCPSCGLTRSFFALAKGDLFASVKHHLFGWIIFITLFFVSWHLLLEIITKKKVKSYYVKLLKRPIIQYLFVISLLIYYFIKLLVLYFYGNLSENFQLSPLAELIYH